MFPPPKRRLTFNGLHGVRSHYLAFDLTVATKKQLEPGVCEFEKEMDYEHTPTYKFRTEHLLKVDKKHGETEKNFTVRLYISNMLLPQ
jgi:hypothetical protein